MFFLFLSELENQGLTRGGNPRLGKIVLEQGQRRVHISLKHIFHADNGAFENGGKQLSD